jgi:glycosyltransferase involved in cell wall biosynthesis
MNGTPSPELSVIVATHNRRELLRRCLEALARQTQPPESFEVIVADDGSDDGTATMVEALRAPFPLHFLALEKSGHAAAQNAALEVATGPVCLLLDDDVVASPELVAAHIEGHREHPGAIGIGALTQEPVAARDWYAHAYARGWAEHYEEMATREAHWTDCYGANLSAPREALEEIDGISTDIPSAKDFDLALRLSAVGCKPVYLPAAHGVHDDQKRSDRMLVDAERAGAMHVALSERYPYAGPELLDWEAGAGPRELALRRLCLALHVPAALPASVGGLIPGEGRKMLWQHFVRRLAFWTGVRRNVNRHAWTLLLHGSTAIAVAEGLTAL